MCDDSEGTGTTVGSRHGSAYLTGLSRHGATYLAGLSHYGAAYLVGQIKNLNNSINIIRQG